MTIRTDPEPRRTPAVSGDDTGDGKPRNPERIARLGARLAFAAVILLATLSPWRFDADAASVLEDLRHALQPSLSPRDLVDGVRNLALFAGWGAVWFVTGPRARPWPVVLAATATGAALSLLVELLQLLSPSRTASVLDVLTNSAGALGGAMVTALCIVWMRAARGERSFVGVPAALLAVPYAGAAMLEALIPLFRQETLAWGGPLPRLRAAVEHFQTEPALSFPLLDVPLFFPAGALAVAALVERGVSYRAAGIVVALAGAALSGLLEMAGAMVGQPIEPPAAVAHALGAAVGAAAAAWLLPTLTLRLRRRPRALALLVAYAAVLALWSWRPFVPELTTAAILTELSPARLIPLRAHAERVDLFSVVDISVLFLLYLPLGALLAVWPLRRRGAWQHLLPALYLTVFLEAGQILIAERFFDITDILVKCAGAAAGWMLMRRAGFAAYGEALPAATPPRE
ncbi:MAG TPA: VanZ family protein [Longimicrobiaceae bacterium]|nr:VanZ family protein [Longimicrobiaceae bacterium]